MTYQPPVGARDLLPLDVAQKHWIETRLQDVFHRWGYQWIVTSTVERVETLLAGGAVERRTIISIPDGEEGPLGLRPELTASIARAAVTRMAAVTHPQRLYYIANVFREPGRSGPSRQREFFQAGMELLGSGGAIADAEAVLLLADCLKAVGLDDWQLLLGEAGLTRSLLEPFPEPWRDRVRSRLANLDRVGLEALELPPALRERALALFDLRGEPLAVLARVAALELTEPQRQMVANLKNLVELLAIAAGRSLPLVLDLSLVQTFDYYTGIVFEAVSGGATVHQRLGQGGRYDRLLGVYDPEGKSYPGIGFGLNLEPLHQVLLKGDRLPQQTPATDWLVVPRSPQAQGAAFAHAQTLRQTPERLVRVELDLNAQDPPEAIRDRARQRRIAAIAWVEADGQVMTESP